MTRQSALVHNATALLVTLILALPAQSALLPESPDWSVLDLDEETAHFGEVVSCAGDVNGDGFDEIILADWGYGIFGDDNDGAVWVYAGSMNGLGMDADWIYESDNPGANFGLSADAAGDVNGDGYGDIVIGAPGYQKPDWSRGAAYVFHGSAAGLFQEPDAMLRMTTGQGVSLFGYSVAGAGDIDGDGYDDVAVGVGDYDPGDGIRRWAIFVYYGSADGIVDDPDIVVPGENAKAYSIHVARAGDVNGDGHADLIVGDAYYLNTQTQEGAAFVYAGSPDGIDPTPIWEVRSDQPHQSWFALRVAGAGDVNGDGFDDVLVGAQGYERPGLPDGAAFLYFGSPAGPSFDPDWAGYPNGYVQQTEHSDASYGQSLDGVGDLDVDGFDDIVIGARSFTSSADAPSSGVVFVYRGSSTVPAEKPDWIGYAPDESWAYFGFADGAVAGVGDVNGDGHADILVGDGTYRIGEESGGGAAAYYGGPVDGDDDDDVDDDGDDDADDDGGGNDDSDDDAGADDDSVPDTNGSRGDSLVQDDDGPCGC